MAKKLLKKILKKALPLAALGLGAAAMGKNRRNKAIDAGIAAADEEPGALIRDYGPHRKSNVAKVASTVPNWINTEDPHQYRWPTGSWGKAYKKGGRVTGAAKRGFGRALMKGKK